MKLTLQPIDGYAFGAVQSSVIVRFEDFQSPAGDTARILRQCLALVPGGSEPNRFKASNVALNLSAAPVLLVSILDNLNKYCGDQRFTPIYVFQDGKALCFALPTLSPRMCAFNLNYLQKTLRTTEAPLTPETSKKKLEVQKAKARPYLPSGTNAGNFITAAAERKFPFKIFNQRYVIFGYGSGSTIFNSSITDSERSIGVSLAKSKVDTNLLLGLSGFPVAEQKQIKNLDDARRFAHKIGFPVVLKPAYEEQGRGIFANIQSDADLESCFQTVSKKYKSLLIERHIAGDHYRIDFMGDTLIKAVRRRAASVIGDGKSSIQTLIDKLNLEPERLDPNSSKGLVKIDDDLHRSLKNQNLSLEDVPDSFRKVYLKSISNMSQGGEQEHVENDIHPENYELCKSIARTIRLELSGIDILSPDLSVPWHRNGATICEVNAQPQLGQARTEVYWKVLSQHVSKPPKLSLIICNKLPNKTDSLFDTALEDIAVHKTPREILENGSPLQYFDRLEISRDVSESDRKKLQRMLVSVPQQG